MNASFPLVQTRRGEYHQARVDRNGDAAVASVWISGQKLVVVASGEGAGERALRALRVAVEQLPDPQPWVVRAKAEERWARRAAWGWLVLGLALVVLLVALAARGAR